MTETEHQLERAADLLYELLGCSWDSISVDALTRIVNRAEHLADLVASEVARALDGPGG